MRNPQAVLRACIPIAWLFVATVSSCSDAPTSPASEVGSASAHTPRFSSTIDQSGNVVLWHDGMTYQLDVQRQEIVRNDGMVIRLTIDEAAEAATTFYAIADNDGLTTELGNAPPPPPPPDDPPCGEGGACDQSIRSPPGALEQYPDNESATTSSSFQMRPHADASSQSSDRTVSAMNESYPPSCQEIALTIYEVTNEFKSKRNTFIEMLKRVLSDGPVEPDASGRPTVDFPNPAEWVMAWDMAVHEHLKLHTQLNILAWMYSNYGCGSSSWGLSWGENYPDYILVCDWVWADVSTDGGRTWRTMRVEVCEYKHV